VSETQVVVIGSGPGGAAIAWSLAEAGVGRILEAGPRDQPQEDYRLQHNDWEQQLFPEKVPSRGRHTHAPLQMLDVRWDDLRSWNHLEGPHGRVAGPAFAAYSHVVGWAAPLHYAGESHRLHPRPADEEPFLAWPPTGRSTTMNWSRSTCRPSVASVWPAGRRSHPSRSAPYPMSPHPLSYGSQRIASGFENRLDD
jgi:choline dehydrogenase-like flavoprotein